MKNFFRNDLKLEKKWWHRLVCVAWILSIIVVLFFCGLYIYEWSYGAEYDTHKVYVWPLHDRANDDIKDINDLLKPWEYVDFTPYSHSNRYDISSLLEIPYWITRCSKRWSVSKISELDRELGNQLVKDRSKIKYSLFNDSVYWKSAVYWKISAYWEIAESINGDCIFLVDWVFHYDLGSLSIYTVEKPNKFKVTMWWLLPRLWESILAILVYIWLSLLIYYKGILYIIYWKSE